MRASVPGGYPMPGKRAKPVPGPQRRVLLPHGHVATASTLAVTHLTLQSYTPRLSTETRLHSHRHGIVCACAGRVACLHSDNLPDCPTLCPYLCALRCPRYPRVASPLCAALALVVLVTRVLRREGPGMVRGTCASVSQEAIACHESCFYAWGGWLSGIEPVARASPCRRWLSPQLFCGTMGGTWGDTVHSPQEMIQAAVAMISGEGAGHAAASGREVMHHSGPEATCTGETTSSPAARPRERADQDTLREDSGTVVGMQTHRTGYLWVTLSPTRSGFWGPQHHA